jgi:hypothetical protein
MLGLQEIAKENVSMNYFSFETAKLIQKPQPYESL